MKFWYVTIITVLLVLFSAMSGYALAENQTTTAAATFPLNVTDTFGITTTIDKAPERIISLSPANTEMLFGIGMGSKIVGTDDYSDYPAEAKNITHVSGYSGVNYEKIMAVNPDLIFAEDVIGPEAITSLRDKGLKVIEVKNNNISSIKKNILLMGKVTGAESNATALVSDMDARLDNISAKAGQLNETQKPTVLLLAGYLSGQPIYAYGSNTYGDELITITGGKNAAGDLFEYKVMSSEVIIAQDPDYIIVPVDGTMTTERDFNDIRYGNESWMKGLKAVKNGNVVWVDGNLMMHPGPRLTEAGLIIAEAIHPAAATPTPTTAPTATATATPGFEPVLALAGLLCIAYLAMRKEN